VEAREARGQRGDPSGGLTSGGGAMRRASGGGARCVRRSGRGGEERGARMSTVELVGGVAPLL
jgi:hypothetical protein